MKLALKVGLITFAAMLLIVVIIATIFISNIMKQSSGVTFDKNKLITTSNQVILLDENAESFSENLNIIKPVVQIEQLPSHVANSFISIEDKRFYSHHGLDYKRIAKAMYNNIRKGKLTEGASTISQQLIKNTHLSSEKTFSRKINEMILTKKLEKQFSKKDILETYLNVIYFGEGSYGIEQASQNYFSKSAAELTLEESALLAGIIKSPATYSPIYNYENAFSRRNLVLKQMLTNNKITQSQYVQAVATPITLNIAKTDSTFSLYAKASIAEAAEILNLSQKDVASNGFKIYTYLNQDQQELLEETINNSNFYHINSFGNVADSLSIVLDNQTNGVVAYSGKSNYNLVNFKRQPGSTIKPILVYAPAMEKGIINPSTQILDEEININGYSPNNVGNVFHGYVSVQESISKSLNIPAVKVLDYVGINQAKQFAQKAGIEFSNTDNGLAIALGGFSEGVNLKDLTNSFTPFANNGMYQNAKFVKKIEDASGKIIYEDVAVKNKIMSDDTAFLITSTLIDGVQNGTSKKLSTLPYEVAGKTGTVAIPNTNQNTDAFSVAYTTQHTMGVWLGNYSNDKEFVLEGSNNGGTYATAIIKEHFKNIYSNNYPANFTVPPSVVQLDIDTKTLTDQHIIMLADENTPERYVEKAFFSNRFKPKEVTTLFTNLMVENFNVEYANEKAIIKFLAKDYLEYDVIKVENGKETIIKNINNKHEKIEFVDENLKPSTKYYYYIKVTNTHSNIYQNSDSILILTNAKEVKYENLIDKLNEKPKTTNNSNGNSWYFTSGLM